MLYKGTSEDKTHIVFGSPVFWRMDNAVDVCKLFIVLSFSLSFPSFPSVLSLVSIHRSLVSTSFLGILRMVYTPQQQHKSMCHRPQYMCCVAHVFPYYQPSLHIVNTAFVRLFPFKILCVIDFIPVFLW